MKTFSIPYYTSSLELHVDEKNLKAELNSRTDTYDAGKSEADLVRDALANPIGTPRLSELAKGKDKIVLVTSDHTRAVPSKLTLPILLEEIRSGNPDADITILIATGLHRATTEEEQRRMFGDNIVDNEKIDLCCERFTRYAEQLQQIGQPLSHHPGSLLPTVMPPV